MKRAVRLQRIAASFCCKRRTQALRSRPCGGPGSIRCLPTAREEAAGHELSAGPTVTDMSRKDRQRVSDVFRKRGN